VEVPLELPDRFRALEVGYPKSGKSGTLRCLLEAGYRVIYNDFDGNPEVLKINGKRPDNLIYLPYEDKIRATGDKARIMAGVSGEPKAYLRYMEFLETGKYISPDGKEKEDHGPMISWGPDTFNVTDSITRLIEAIWRRYLFTISRSQRRKQDWGAIVEELSYVAEMNMAMRLSCHSIMIAHFQLTGAEELEEDDNTGKRQDLIEHNNEIKKQKADLIGPRLFPRAVTKAQSEVFAGKFPCILPLIVNDEGKRIFDLQPKKELMVALPASHAKVPKTLPQETGLLEIFKAITGKGT
jgi:hypothetical protein